MEKEKQIYFKNRAEWRAWLEKNHLKEKKIAIIKYKKHTGKPSMSHKESMDEAICFGWIDTTIKRLDEDRYIRRFARRSDKSRWSNATLGYAKELIKQKRMSAEGLKRYKEGLGRPVIDHGLGKNPPVPEDLQKALAQDKQAEENFKVMAPSYRRTYLVWLYRAKQPETRQKRIKIIVEQTKRRKRWGK